MKKQVEVLKRENRRLNEALKKAELIATGPNQVWSWDITKLKGPAKWTYFHLYVILAIFFEAVSEAGRTIPLSP